MDELEIEEWSELEPRERATIRARICERLGNEWTLDDGTVMHVPTDMEFVVVPGGTMKMGIRGGAEEQLRSWLLAAARTHALENAVLQRGFEPELDREAESELASFVARARPVHRVRVAPFLCAREVWRREDDMDPPRVSREVANAQAHQHQLRLPSEAELEWIVREGDPEQFMVLGLTMANAVPGSPFFRMRDVTIHGVADVYEAQWAADDWHDDYRGAPASSDPWLDGDAKGVTRCGCDPRTIMDHEALIALLAGARAVGSHASLRLAHDIPT